MIVLYLAEVQSDSELMDGQLGSDSGTERDYTSDSELYSSHMHHGHHKGSQGELDTRPNTGSWFIVSSRQQQQVIYLCVCTSHIPSIAVL